MPGIYSNNKFDLAGFSVGIVSKKKILNKNNVLSKNVVLAIQSSGINSNGYSLVRSILKNNKIPNNLKNEILKPTKIYSKEILKLTKKNLINSAAHITGGGLVENLLRSVPDNLTLNIDLAKIKTLKIFSWLKTKNITDQEMIKTFNCGVGFCLIVKQKNVAKVKKVFSKQFKPYEIGYISKSKERINVINCIKW
jgi:phosphoribosylaminoimidazole synthetase